MSYLNDLAVDIYITNFLAGWWTDPEFQFVTHQGPVRKYAIAAKLALVHSEISEALEGFRKGLKDDHLPHRDMLEVELADAVIRILDIVGALNLDLDGAIAEKRAYNAQRVDHQPEVRAAVGGKSL